MTKLVYLCSWHLCNNEKEVLVSQYDGFVWFCPKHFKELAKDWKKYPEERIE